MEKQWLGSQIWGKAQQREHSLRKGWGNRCVALSERPGTEIRSTLACAFSILCFGIAPTPRKREKNLPALNNTQIKV